MKVLYLSGMYPVPKFPQQGIFCHEQVKAMIAEGAEVTVVVPITIYDKQRENRWEHEGVDVRYVRFVKFPGVWGYEHIGKWLYIALQGLGMNFADFDVIHADAPLPAGYAAMCLSRKYKIPYVIHCHGLDVFLNEDYGQHKNYRKILACVESVYRNADAIVGVSRKTLDNVCARMPVQEKCHVAYNGVDTERFSPAEKKTKNKFLRVISIGNLIDLKGHDISIRAIHKLIQLHNLPVRLQIYGRGVRESALKSLVGELGLEGAVSFGGYVAYEEVAKELRNYDVFLLPSWYEAIGCVYLEAMASGLLTIGCYQNGIDEVITDGENGFLVRPKNEEDVVNVLLHIAYHFMDQEMEMIAKNGRKTVAEHFTWKHSADSLIQVYKTII